MSTDWLRAFIEGPLDRGLRFATRSPGVVVSGAVDSGLQMAAAPGSTVDRLTIHDVPGLPLYVGPGVDASHAFERTHEDALRATAALLSAYLDAPLG